MDRYSAMRDDAKALKSSAVQLCRTLESFNKHVESLLGDKGNLNERQYITLKFLTEENQYLLQEYRDVRKYLDVYEDDPATPKIKGLEAFELEFALTKGTASDILERAVSKRPKIPVAPSNRPRHNSCDSEGSVANSSAIFSNHGSQDHSTAHGSVRSSTKLPPIKIPRFSGDSCEWIAFRDIYVATIHNSRRIAPVEKLIHLRSCLTDEPSALISSLPITNDSYEAAWGILNDRYNDTRELIRKHIENLTSIPKVKKESAQVLYNLVQRAKTSLFALDALGSPVAPHDAIIMHNILDKLDKQTRRDWELSNAENCTIHDLLEHLQSKARLISRLESSASQNEFESQVKQPRNNPNSRSQRTAASAQVLSASYNQKPFVCLFCREPTHYTSNCNSFTSLGNEQRLAKVTREKLCLNCMRKGHAASECRSRFRCNECKQAHHTKLHDALVTAKTANEVACTSAFIGTVGLLPTVQVKLIGPHGQSITGRALLDSGAQTNMLSAKCCSLLKLQPKPTSTSIVGIGGLKSTATNFVTVQVQSRCQSFKREIKCFVLDRLTSNLPATHVNLDKLQLPGHIQLADPHFHVPDSIDLIIGGEVFWDCLLPHQQKLPTPGTSLQCTKFGWIVVGRLLPVTSLPPRNLIVHHSLLEFDLRRFWEQEEIPDNKPQLSVEEQRCEDIFDATTSRDSTGRFIVRLPTLALPDAADNNSRFIAERRFHSLEKRLTADPDLRREYSNFIHEYCQLGHMSLVEKASDTQNILYLPHHAVFKHDSTTTKLRVVFDASCRLSNGKSPNDYMLRGPVLQDDIVNLLIRFRSHRYAITADIEKMYRQIIVHADDREKQCILWRGNDNTIQTFQLNTVTYGTKPASYLATKCLQVAGKNAENQSVRDAICQDFYMDDLLTGCDDESSLQSLCNAIQSQLAKFGFNLRKWRSNSQSITNPDAVSPLQIVDKQRSKTLGLVWDSFTDDLLHSFDSSPRELSSVTKRSALSAICKIFDPLGLLAPVLIRAKLFIQQLWILGVDWDESLPACHQQNLNQILQEISTVGPVAVPRRAVVYSEFQVHIFVDASEAAFSAVAYIRSVFENNIAVRLLCAKTRLAPLKPITIPCLELCGAVLGVKLADLIAKSLNLDIKVHFQFWTDSSIVLAWLQTMPHRLKTFVCHRVSKIQEATFISQWQHVRSKQNPADLATRGLPSVQWKASTQWWHGPAFLSRCKSTWPTTEPNLPSLGLEISAHVVTNSSESNIIDVHRFSSFTRLLRVMLYILRFTHNKTTRKHCTYRLARQKIFRLAQRNSFPQEIAALVDKKALPSRSKLLKLTPFLDDAGLLRITGRVVSDNVNYNEQHPIILAPDHHVTRLLYQHLHDSLLHAGPQLIVAESRREVWVLRARQLASSVCQKCVKCYKHKPTNNPPLMGNLPSVRTTPSFPFSSVGIDFAGPLLLQVAHLRGARSYKAYVAVFICMVTRAIHLEVVSDLSTDAFLACLRRFTARRGLPAHIYSDNGTNFVGTKSELQRLFAIVQSSTVTDELAKGDCEWHFIPPSAPHFGGLWEAAVKSMKYHLKRQLGESKLTFEEMSTLLCQIESILNSRPLCALYDDSNDPTPISPAHFLIGRSLLSVPSDSNSVSSLRLRFRSLQGHLRQFWHQWRSAYLRALQQRAKWDRADPDATPKVGQVVIVKNDTLPPNKWEMARIVETHPGTDGFCRVATIRYSNGTTTTRPMIKLYPLPIQE